jgi:hypothetical protein
LRIPHSPFRILYSHLFFRKLINMNTAIKIMKTQSSG